MLIKLRHPKKLIFLIAVCTTLLHFLKSSNIYFSAYDYTLRPNTPYTLRPKCACHSEIVSIKTTAGLHNIDIHNPHNTENDYNYNITTEKFEELSLGCDLYKVLRRGNRQKVISFSLYGKLLKFFFIRLS